MYSQRFQEPENSGALVKEKVRCGKPWCFCFKKERFHEGYALYYRDYPNGGKLKKKYVRKADVPNVRMFTELAKFADMGKRKRLSNYEQLRRYAKMFGEESEPDWRQWIVASDDFTPEQKRRVMNDEPIDDSVGKEDLSNWIGIPIAMDDGKTRLIFYQRDELELYRRVAAGEQLFS